MSLKMSAHPLSGSNGKQAIISLSGLSHVVCVAVTETEYWQQVSFNNKNQHESIHSHLYIANTKFEYFNYDCR